MKRLEEIGLIRHYVAILDAAKLGLGLTAYATVRMDKHSDSPKRSAMKSFRDVVQGWREVVACYAMTGEMDYLLRVQTVDLDHYSALRDGQAAAASFGAGRAVELHARADQGHDGVAPAGVT